MYINLCYVFYCVLVVEIFYCLLASLSVEFFFFFKWSLTSCQGVDAVKKPKRKEADSCK